MTSRVISFAGSSVRIESEGLDAERLVEFLYRDFPPSEGPPPHMTLHVRAEPGAEALTLHCGDKRYYHGNSLGSLASALLEQTIYHLSDKSRGGLVLHAAAVSMGRRCLLLPGRTGVGKTTLTAWLVKKGFGYLTDELVYVPSGSMEVRPFVRPLNIKARARQSLGARILDYEASASQIVSATDVTLVPSALLGGGAALAEARLGRIVFPQYQAGAGFAVEPLSRAETGLGLMGCLINARNLPEHGFPEVARLAREAPGFHLRYGDFAQLEDWASLLRQRDVKLM